MIWRAGHRATALAPLLAACLSASCVPARIRLPEGPGLQAADFAETFAGAVAACQGVRTVTAEIAVSGKVAGERLRGRVLSGFERPGSLRLEALAPFGSPYFILASSPGQAVLLLPRDRRVLSDATSRDIIQALTGLDCAPDDLLALLTGCVVPRPRAADGQSLRGDWLLVSLDGGSRAYLRRIAGAWRVVAGERLGTAGGQGAWLTVEYGEFAAGLPTKINVWQDAEAGVRASAALAFRLSQVETNVAIDPKAFTVTIPPGTDRLTIDELRRSGPLAGSADRYR